VDITHEKHYHDYRATILRKDGRPPSILECDEEYDFRIENAKKSIAEQIQRKDEEIRQNFVQLARQQEHTLRMQEEQVRIDQLSWLLRRSTCFSDLTHGLSGLLYHTAAEKV
jgi:hypothetical protein